MIVRHFLHWVATANAADRAEATGALARSYLYSDLSDDERSAAEHAMVMTLDDPSAMVRAALAEALADDPEAPAMVVAALAADRPEIAAVVLERSPLLLDADLVDTVGSADPVLQAAVARRAEISGPVAAALAEVGSAESCLILIENPGAMLPAFSLDRIVARFGHLSAIRQALLARGDLTPAARQALAVKLATSLADFVVAQDWMGDHRARQLARDACERATVAMAAQMPVPDLAPLVTHLRESGQLTAGFLLRTLLSGNMPLFEQALAELARLPLRRIVALVHDGRGRGIDALLRRAGLPATVWPAVRAALEAAHEVGFVGDAAGAVRLKRQMVERVLTCCEADARGFAAEPLLVLLRRFALEAVRDEARLSLTYEDRAA